MFIPLLELKSWGSPGVGKSLGKSWGGEVPGEALEGSRFIDLWLQCKYPFIQDYGRVPLMCICGILGGGNQTLCCLRLSYCMAELVKDVVYTCFVDKFRY